MLLCDGVPVRACVRARARARVSFCVCVGGGGGGGYAIGSQVPIIISLKMDLIQG